jgi:hypothetical protein
VERGILLEEVVERFGVVGVSFYEFSIEIPES